MVIATTLIRRMRDDSHHLHVPPLAMCSEHFFDLHPLESAGHKAYRTLKWMKVERLVILADVFQAPCTS